MLMHIIDYTSYTVGGFDAHLAEIHVETSLYSYNKFLKENV